MKNEIVESKRMALEELSEELQSNILELALHCRLSDIVLELKKQGVETSAASLSRFIRRDRERRLLEDRKEIEGTVNALAESGRGGKLREGTLEAVRQRLYERTLVSQSPEEARELYAAMVKEEARLRELELEARKVAVAEQQVKLQGLKIEVEVAKARSQRPMKSAEVVEARAVAGELGEGSAEKERLAVTLKEVIEIVNRGGAPEEKVLELRARLGREVGA